MGLPVMALSGVKGRSGCFNGGYPGFYSVNWEGVSKLRLSLGMRLHERLHSLVKVRAVRAQSRLMSRFLFEETPGNAAQHAAQHSNQVKMQVCGLCCCYCCWRWRW